MMDDVGKPFALLLSASNTECVGMILSGAAFKWIPVIAPPPQQAFLGDFGQ
jgi:hypothetical protein